MAACRTVVTADYDYPYTDFLIDYIKERARKLGATSTYCRPSPSGKGVHCTFCFAAELSEEERLVLSIVLLDDPARILFNLRRLCRMGRLVDLLFQVKRKLLREAL